MIIAFQDYLYLSTTILLAINPILDITTVKQEISSSPVGLRINLNFSLNTASIVTDTTDSINHQLSCSLHLSITIDQVPTLLVKLFRHFLRSSFVIKKRRFYLLCILFFFFNKFLRSSNFAN